MFNDLDYGDEDLSCSKKGAPSKPKSSIFSKAKEEDAKVLYQISYLLDKKEPKNKKTKSHVDDGDDDDDSESSGIVSLDNGYKEIFDSNDSSLDLGLTKKDQELFIREGYSSSQQRPSCTKSEERALKRIRRKIKNKLSAQESRRKKKEYVESLEKRVESCNSENSILREQVHSLDNTVRTLLKELKRMQGTTTKQNRGTQTGTCLKCYLKNTTGQPNQPHQETDDS